MLIKGVAKKLNIFFLIIIISAIILAGFYSVKIVKKRVLPTITLTEQLSFFQPIHVSLPGGIWIPNYVEAARPINLLYMPIPRVKVIIGTNIVKIYF